MILMFIDDEPDSIVAATAEIRDSVRDVVISVFNFEHAMEELASVEPDIVILDVWDGPPPEFAR